MGFTDQFFIASRIGLWLISGLLIDSLYASGTWRTPQGLIIVIAVLFITVFITGIITIIYIPGLILDKPVFIRESNDGCYRTISYTCANFLIEAIAVACSSIAYTCVLYWAIGGLDPSAGAFFFFMFTHFVYSLTACVITLTIAAPLPSIEVSAGALMINQFEDVSIDLCGDVKNPLSLTEILDLAGSMDNLESQGSSLNVNDIVCGFVQIPTMSPMTSSVRRVKTSP